MLPNYLICQLSTMTCDSKQQEEKIVQNDEEIEMSNLRVRDRNILRSLQDLRREREHISGQIQDVLLVSGEEMTQEEREQILDDLQTRLAETDEAIDNLEAEWEERNDGDEYRSDEEDDEDDGSCDGSCCNGENLEYYESGDELPDYPVVAAEGESVPAFEGEAEPRPISAAPVRNIFDEGQDLFMERRDIIDRIIHRKMEEDDISDVTFDVHYDYGNEICTRFYYYAHADSDLDGTNEIIAPERFCEPEVDWKRRVSRMLYILHKSWSKLTSEEEEEELESLFGEDRMPEWA